MSLDVIHNGQPQYSLNHALIKKNNVSLENIEKIKKLHANKLGIFDEMRMENSTQILKAYANLVETIEYELQSLWGFSRDKNHHEWYLVPKCQCPKIDNQERLGTPYKIINKSCPIHGED